MVAFNNNRTIKVKARLRLYSGPGMRQMPFFDGYRPLFKFDEMDKFVSGSISQVSENGFYPNSDNDIEITFLIGLLPSEILKEGNHFLISEGGVSIGEGKILKKIEP